MTGPDRPFKSGWMGDQLHPSRIGKLDRVTHGVGRLLAGIVGFDRAEMRQDQARLALLAETADRAEGLNKVVLGLIQDASRLPDLYSQAPGAPRPPEAQVLSEAGWGDKAGPSWGIKIIGPSQEEKSGGRQVLEMPAIQLKSNLLVPRSAQLTAYGREGEARPPISVVTVEFPHPIGLSGIYGRFINRARINTGPDGSIETTSITTMDRIGYNESVAKDNFGIKEGFVDFLDGLQDSVQDSLRAFDLPDTPPDL